MALLRLDRRDEAGAAMEGALARDPDDAFTHANRGWSLLHEGDPRRALEHFREALRLEPELDFARAGLIEALKARYWLYRQVLRYFLWIARLTPGARWAVVIGLVVCQQVVARTMRANPELTPILMPLLIGYLTFALTTWTAAPLTNLMLRLNRFGRLVLSPEERTGSNWVGAFVIIALICLGYGIVRSSPLDLPGWIGAFAFVWLLMPVSATFACQPGWPRWVMATYTTVMFVMAVTMVWLMWSAFAIAEQDLPTAKARVRASDELLTAHLWAGLIAGFLGNWLMSVRPRQ
jgi:tetratricopeptide repeat protein